MLSLLGMVPAPLFAMDLAVPPYAAVSPLPVASGVHAAAAGEALASRGFMTQPVGVSRVFDKWAASKFRSRFKLSAGDREYIQQHGRDVIIAHARDFIFRRLAPAAPHNDGKQTPYRGHPVFTAQHATATCCRSCLLKWHGIPRGVALTAEQQDYVVQLVIGWIDQSHSPL